MSLALLTRSPMLRWREFGTSDKQLHRVGAILEADPIAILHIYQTQTMLAYAWVVVGVVIATLGISGAGLAVAWCTPPPTPPVSMRRKIRGQHCVASGTGAAVVCKAGAGHAHALSPHMITYPCHASRPWPDAPMPARHMLGMDRQK